MSNTLLPEDFRNASADLPWKKSETDRMLDEYFDGAAPAVIAARMQRNLKAVQRRLEQFSYNERDRSVLYAPFRRVSRKGKRLTPNELAFVKAHRQRQVPLDATARVLARAKSELEGLGSNQKQVLQSLPKQFVPTLDTIAALRYAYHVYGKGKAGVVSDKQYDDLVEEEREFGNAVQLESILMCPASKVPSRIRSLALYFQELKNEGLL